MILIYTGNGKGKTCACVGQAVRAHGRGMAVAFAQFMKRPDQAGEQAVLGAMLGNNFFAGGEGFFRRAEAFPEHRAAALAVLEWAKTKIAAGIKMLVLDEALYALGSSLLQEDELRGLIKLCRSSNTHLVLSGRGLPPWLSEEADTISELQEIKHHFRNGIPAVEGIEF